MKFRQQLVGWLLGLGFLSFYITMAVVPAVNRDNIRAETKIAKTEDSLQKVALKLEKLNDTLRNKENALKDRASKITALEKARNTFDSSFRAYLSISTKEKSQLNDRLRVTRELYQRYAKKKSEYSPFFSVFGVGRCVGDNYLVQLVDIHQPEGRFNEMVAEIAEHLERLLFHL